jgi:hypothetical protein
MLKQKVDEFAGLPALLQVGYFMTHPLQESRVRIGRFHLAAIGKEIGERLRTSLNKRSVRLPASLINLMQRLREDRSGRSANPGA